MKNKGFTPIIILLVIVVVALMGVAYLAGSKGILTTKPLVSISSPTPFPETPPADPTADWKTFINTKYSYSLKYPSSYDVVESGMASGLVEKSGAITVYDKTIKDPQLSPHFSISILLLDKETLEERIQKHFAEISSFVLSEQAKNNFKLQFGDVVSNKAISQITKTKFLDQVAYEYAIGGNTVNSGIDEYISPIQKHNYIWISRNGNIYLIYSADTAIMNQIFSTFKFTR